MVADPGGVDPDPSPTFKKKPDPYPIVKKESNLDPTLAEKKPGS